MDDPITRFFAAWQVESADARSDLITAAVTADVEYADPNAPAPIHGAHALAEYVGMFSASAPGWSARVLVCDTIAETTRATVAFGGPGPDGSDQQQLGQYFVEFRGEQISRMIGFVGIGAPA
ncbi:MAG: nuclear transport factor 2 family protein [Pseudomonadota bacterium]